MQRLDVAETSLRLEWGVARVEAEDHIPGAPIPWQRNRHLRAHQYGRGKDPPEATDQSKLSSVERGTTAGHRPDQQLKANSRTCPAQLADGRVANFATLDPTELRVRKAHPAGCGPKARPSVKPGIPDFATHLKPDPARDRTCFQKGRRRPRHHRMVAGRGCLRVTTEWIATRSKRRSSDRWSSYPPPVGSPAEPLVGGKGHPACRGGTGSTDGTPSVPNWRRGGEAERRRGGEAERRRAEAA